MLGKITLGDDFENIIETLKLNPEKKKELFENLRFYLGMDEKEKFGDSFSFFLVNTYYDNGVKKEYVEGYKRLPYEIDKILYDESSNLSWITFGLDDFLSDIKLDISEEKFLENLDSFFKERIQEYISYGLTKVRGYSKKLEETRNFIIRRFVEFRNIISEFI